MPLACGVPVSRSLAPGGIDAYRFTTTPGAAVRDPERATSAARWAASAAGDRAGGLRSDTCTGVNQFIGRLGEMTPGGACRPVRRHRAAGSTRSRLQVVTGGPGTAASRCACGATPDGIGVSTSRARSTRSRSRLIEDDQRVLKAQLPRYAPGRRSCGSSTRSATRSASGRLRRSIEVEPDDDRHLHRAGQRLRRAGAARLPDRVLRRRAARSGR